MQYEQHTHHSISTLSLPLSKQTSELTYHIVTVLSPSVCGLIKLVQNTQIRKHTYLSFYPPTVSETYSFLSMKGSQRLLRLSPLLLKTGVSCENSYPRLLVITLWKLVSWSLPETWESQAVGMEYADRSKKNIGPNTVFLMLFCGMRELLLSHNCQYYRDLYITLCHGDSTANRSGCLF